MTRYGQALAIILLSAVSAAVVLGIRKMNTYHIPREPPCPIGEYRACRCVVAE